MAYNSHNLSVLAYANGFTLWHYGTGDTADQVDSSGYFNTAAEMLRVGDMIMANCDTDGTPVAGIFLVRVSSGGVVDVSNMTQVGAANTD
jgi:hypothetical protein